MDKNNDELSRNQKEFIDFLEKASTNDSTYSKKIVKNKKQGLIHPNSLITKNISLFSNNPNYKLLAWLIVQLIIFSLFIFVVTILKSNFVPYINSI
tara:strand:+ start:495 stop:782 length:288 start_codon:yes stop_codon:yes gene_type:complete